MARYAMRLGAGRFVAGETLDEAVAATRRLNDERLAASLTLLGEHVTERAEATRVVEQNEAIMDRLAALGLDANVGVKLTSIGLRINEGFALENADRLASHADGQVQRLRVDMEESFTVDATLRVFRGLVERGHPDLEIALQSYLRRTEADARALLPLRPKIRIVKGAYLEAATVAFPDKKDVDASYARLLDLLLGSEAHVCVATHDDRLIERAIALVEQRRVPRDRFEFQLLYGIRRERQLDLVRRGYRVLISVPFGPEWYPYLTRRLAERPANLVFFLANFFRR